MCLIGDGITNKLVQENIISVTETEITGYCLEQLERALRQHAKAVSDCDLVIRDAMINLSTAMKMEDIKESKDLKAKMNDAAANRAIFDLKVQVVALKIKQYKHDRAMALCGDDPKLPYGMDIITFGGIMDHIYEHTESALISDPTSIDGKKMKKQIDAVVKANPSLKNHIKEIK